MPARVTAIGNLGADLEQRFTQSGKAVVTLSIGVTPRRKDQSGQWGNDGQPVWLKATYWEKEADAIINTGIGRGAKVTITGTLGIEAYTTKDGRQGSNLVLKHPSMPGIIPPVGQPPQQAGGYNQPPQPQGSYQAPAGGQQGDPWSVPDNPPF